ncbi:hypothetical protein, partial [Roseicyclus sp.]|uniref:hypothetical protein n=1 Tax=Roseicyclus sp. TaxID=1914329 RepID=UPI001BCB39E6
MPPGVTRCGGEDAPRPSPCQDRNAKLSDIRRVARSGRGKDDVLYQPGISFRRARHTGSSRGRNNMAITHLKRGKPEAERAEDDARVR